MHLRSISMKGFKSFPDKMKLDFSPGVSVIVGPNGSGKSNITDAVLWAMGEQKPLAVRGQTMQDVIFAGGHGLPSRNAAEVEVVIDNSDGALDSEFSEISIVRRLERSGEGEYRLNGARCRLVDVLEVLSDTGLGKEMHSVVSQGRVEAIIHSKPRDRRMLIEEAAGLGKHRKRRRRAQLKLERTEANLARALDVEREARSRLRPLKRQAEAAELHERLERQSLEARLQLVRDHVRAAAAELASAESQAAAARAERDQIDRRLAEVAQRREAAEEALAAHGRMREELSGRYYSARSSAERIGLRLERARETERSLTFATERRGEELELLRRSGSELPSGGPHAERIAELERELESLEAERGRELEGELERLRVERDAAELRRVELEAAVRERRAALTEAERSGDEARAHLREAERRAEAARREAAAVGAELASVNQFLRSAAATPGGARALAEDLGVDAGYEGAVAAALGPLLAAGVVAAVSEGESLLDSVGGEGGIALVAPGEEHAPAEAEPPVPSAERLLDHVAPADSIAALAERLLAGVWVVESLGALPAHFHGVAVTRSGRLFSGATGELRQAAAQGEERLLERRNRREELVASSERALGTEREALAAVERARDGVAAADGAREQAESALRSMLREEQEAVEAVHRADWLMRMRREEPGEGPNAIRRAQLSADLRAERKLAERAERERGERMRRIEQLAGAIERGDAAAAAAGRAIASLEKAEAAVAARRDDLREELEADQAVGERTAAELRACAHEEADIQTRLRAAGEAVTGAEVRAQQARDLASETRAELEGIAGRLGLDPSGAEEAEPIADELRSELTARIERLARRREQLGPVNPLAKKEYEEAVAHVEELEAQRDDLESALSELDSLIKETDRRIRESFEETFAAAAKNFEEVVAHLFPGGRGRLRLVQPDGPRPVIAGESAGEEAPASEAGFATAAATAVSASADSAAARDADADEEARPDEAAEPGVEVEVTPAGKSMKRLSLLSGGEKSLVALAFLFSVFLARPCPFYILDEVEAALDDANIDRFLQLVRDYCDRAQFIIVTHQRHTMDAADTLYGVSMGGDGVSKVVSRRLAGQPVPAEADEGAGGGSREAA